jgi:hypothetical protein
MTGQSPDTRSLLRVWLEVAATMSASESLFAAILLRFAHGAVRYTGWSLQRLTRVEGKHAVLRSPAIERRPCSRCGSALKAS